MAKLILWLSGRWSPAISEQIQPDDVLLRAPFVQPPKGVPTFDVMPMIPTDDDNLVVAKGLVALLKQTEGRGKLTAARHLQRNANHIASYGAGPIVTALREIETLLQDDSIKSVIVFGHRSGKKSIPLYGNMSLELPRGSRDILGQIITQSVMRALENDPTLEVKHIPLKQDVLSHQGVRRVAFAGGG